MKLNKKNIKGFLSSKEDQYKIFCINYTVDEKKTIIVETDSKTDS